MHEMRKVLGMNGTTHPYHRVLVESHIGRLLKDDEVVHHVNGDPSDNRLENLVIMDYDDHMAYHRWINDQIRECEDLYRCANSPRRKIWGPVISFRLTLEDNAKLNDAVRDSGLSLGLFVRELVLKALGGV